MQLGEPGYDELWAFADLRGSEYASLRVTPTETEDTWVSGLVIAHQRHKDGSHGSFLLVEIDEDANVIGDWVEADLDEAKEHGAVLADREQEGIEWEVIPDADDIRALVRRRLRRPRI